MERCITCTDPKRKCNALGFLSFPASVLVPLCKKRKQFLGFTAQQVAEKSTIPVGTVNRFFSGELADFRYDTAHHIVCVLWNITEGECPVDSERSADDSEVRVLREVVSQQAATIKHYEEQIQRLREQVDRKDSYIDRLAKKAGL